ncbi:type I restriction/modification system N-6 DNA methyltransferase [Helicobacter fennelliae]|nr:type I restriction/modification system N-6 DNA methyltransferase [Helicobacter fennelliae]
MVSKYGRVQTLRESTGNVQLCLFIHKLKELKIPQFSQDFQLEIQKLVQDSHKALEDSKRLYKEAQELLYKELELDFKNPLKSLLKSSLQAKKPSELANINDISKKYPHLNISVRPLSKSLHKSGRLDSEYYQSKYDAIERKIKDYQGGWGYVKTMFSRNNTTCNFLKDKYKYIEIGDINTSNGMASFNEIPTNELPANAKIMIEKNDILISKVRPYRGAVAIIDFDIKDTIASGAFVVLRENGDFKKEVLQVLLRTIIYKEWLLKWNVGTSYPVIKDENILDLPIPKINPATQEQIALKIQKSFTLRAKSKDLLEYAKVKVEQNIQTPANQA